MNLGWMYKKTFENAVMHYCLVFEVLRHMYNNS